MTIAIRSFREVNEAMDKIFRKQDDDDKEAEYISKYPLHAAVERGSIGEVDSLLNGMTEIDEIDWFGCTPLTYAVIKCLQHAIWSHAFNSARIIEKYNNWLQIAERLASRGADIYKMSLPLESVVVPPPRYDIYGIVQNIHDVLEGTDASPLKSDISDLYNYLQLSALPVAEVSEYRTSEVLDYGAAEAAVPLIGISKSKPKRSPSSSSSDSDGDGIRNVKKRKKKKNTRRRKRCRKGTHRNRKTGKCGIRK